MLSSQNIQINIVLSGKWNIANGIIGKSRIPQLSMLYVGDVYTKANIV